MKSGFGNLEPRTFFKIKDGKIVVKDMTTGKESYYDYFCGALKSIIYSEKEVEFNGRKQIIKAYNVTFADDANQIYIWSPAPNTQLFQSFINCLCSLDNFNNVYLELQPYLKDGKQRVSIKYAIGNNHSNNKNWQKLNWKYKPEELPPIKIVYGKNGKPLTDINGNPIYDSEDRLIWIAERVAEINNKLSACEDNFENEVPSEYYADNEDPLKDIPF